MEAEAPSADDYRVVLVAIPLKGTRGVENWLGARPHGVLVSHGPLSIGAFENLLYLKSLLRADGSISAYEFNEAVKATGSNGGMSSVYPRVSRYLQAKRGEEVSDNYAFSPNTALADLVELARRTPTQKLLRDLDVGLPGFERFRLACNFLVQAQELRV